VCSWGADGGTGGGAAGSLFGTKLTVVASAGMEELNFRSLERICRAQAALTTHEATKRQLERMAEEYRRLADLKYPQQDNGARLRLFRKLKEAAG
jgi:hypothetical protein